MNVIQHKFRSDDDLFNDELEQKPTHRRTFAKPVKATVPYVQPFLPLELPKENLLIGHQALDIVSQIVQNVVDRQEPQENRLKVYTGKIKDFLDLVGDKLTLFEKRVFIFFNFAYDGFATVVEFIYKGSLRFYVKSELKNYVNHRVIHLAWFCNFILSMVCFSQATSHGWTIFYTVFLSVQFVRACVLIGSHTAQEINQMEYEESLNQPEEDEREPEKIGDLTFIRPRKDGRFRDA